MGPHDERYVIRGGKKGYERLSVLARERWPDTLAVLRRAGLKPGMRCLDVGCGGGHVTLELARLVAPGGSVVGIDMDEVKLDLGRRSAAEQGLVNLEFRTMNVNDWNELAAYDAIVSRFLLQHLKEPVGLLRRMWAGVRPGGVLVAEDADFGGCFCDPPNDAYEFYTRMYRRVLQRNGGDPYLGRKLYRCFIESDIPNPSVAIVQRVHADGEGKTLAWSTLEATSDAIVASGLAEPKEVSAALASLAEFTADPHTILGGPRVFQVWSTRPSSA